MEDQEILTNNDNTSKNNPNVIALDIVEEAINDILIEKNKFYENFSTKEKEIIALINSKGTFVEKTLGSFEGKSLLEVNSEVVAYIDCKTNTLIKEKANIKWLVSDEEIINNYVYNIEKYHIYHLKVREDKTNNFLLVDVLERNVNNEILENILKEYKAIVVVEEPTLGKFTLDKDLKSFHTKINWLSDKQQINVYLNVNENTRIKALEKIGAFLNTFEKLINNKKEWDKKLKIYSAEHLVDLANELRKSSKSMFKFIKIWRWRFIGKIQLLSLDINPNGEFLAIFNDNKLFLGHRILVNGNTNGELLNSAIVENFNIEDYKENPIAPPISKEVEENKQLENSNNKENQN